MPAATKDKGDRLEFSKSIEGRQSSRTQLAVANEFMEHFNEGAAIPTGLINTGTTPVSATTYGTGLGGTAVLESDDVAGNDGQLTTYLLWQADRQTAALGGQPLVFEAKLKSNSITTVEFFAGLTDATADTAIIALSTTSTFTTSVPTDGVWLGYSATPTSGAAFTTGGNQHVAIGIDTNVDRIAGVGGGAVVADTYYTYRIQVDVAGNAAYFVNGAFVASLSGAVSPDVPLCGQVVGIPRTTASIILTIDYLYVGGV